MAKQLTDEEILAYKEKEPTAFQTRYADWLIEKLEIEFPNTKSEAAFREAVRLSVALRMIMQASEENQAARVEARTAKSKAKAKPAEDDDTEAEAEAPKPKPAAKRPGRPAKAARPTPAAAEDEDDTAVAPAPKPAAPKKAARAGKPAPF